MSTYLFVYHRPPIPADVPPPTPEWMEANMKAWRAWEDRVGADLVDFGRPLAGGVRIGPDGSTRPSETQVAGYSIVEAADLDAARALTEDHPHYQMPGASIEIHETQPIPGR